MCCVAKKKKTVRRIFYHCVMVCAETWHCYQRAAFLDIFHNQMKIVNILSALVPAAKSVCVDWTCSVHFSCKTKSLLRDIVDILLQDRMYNFHHLINYLAKGQKYAELVKSWRTVHNPECSKEYVHSITSVPFVISNRQIFFLHFFSLRSQ